MTIKDLKILANRCFSLEYASATSYTDDELKRVLDALQMLGYIPHPAGVYQNEKKFQGVIFDYLKSDISGITLGLVTLHLDKDNKTALVQDGIITTAFDRDLQEKVGRTTSVPEFASIMNPTLVQRVAKTYFSRG